MTKLRTSLNTIAFVFTILMVLYGLNKGFDTFELILNIIYFTVMVITTFIDLIESLNDER